MFCYKRFMIPLNWPTTISSLSFWMHTPNRKWEKNSSLGELNLYSLLAAAAINISSFERSIGRLWDTVRVITGAANQLTSDAITLAQESGSETQEEKREKILTGVRHLCFDQLHPRHNLQIGGQLSRHAINLWRLGLAHNASSWFHWKSLGPSRVKIRNHKLQCWTTGDAICGLMDHTGTVIINKGIIHLPALLHLLAPMHCALGLPGRL